MTRTNAHPQGPLRAVALLSVAGLGIASYLAYLHYRVHTDPAYSAFCAVDTTVDCTEVAASPYSVFIGIPVALLGALGYAIALVLAVLALLRLERGTAPIGFLAVLGAGMAAASVALAAISVFAVGSLCLLCASTYALNAGIAVSAFAAASRAGGFTACLGREAALARRSPWPAVYAVLVVAIVIIAGPGRGLPRYYELASFRGGPRLAHGVDETGHPWLGARDPELVIHEYFDYDCHACRLAHRKIRRTLSEHARELRLVRHDYARMSCLPTTTDDALRCRTARAARCASGRGRFWDWNDAAEARPKPISGPGRMSYELDLAEMLGFDRQEMSRCMASDETTRFVQQMYEEAEADRIQHTPTYVVDGKRHDLAEVIRLVDERL